MHHKIWLMLHEMKYLHVNQADECAVFIPNPRAYRGLKTTTILITLFFLKQCASILEYKRTSSYVQ